MVANIDREFDKEENEFLKLIGLKMGLHPDAIESVLIEMRQECKLLALRERKQSCFHITNVVCDPDYKNSEF